MQNLSEIFMQSIIPNSSGGTSGNSQISSILGGIANIVTTALEKEKLNQSETKTEVKSESKTESKNDPTVYTKEDQREKSENIITGTMETISPNAERDNVVVNEPKKITTKTNPIKTNVIGPHNVCCTDSRPIIMVPVGTQLCPAERYDLKLEEYYITLNQRITLHLDNAISVVINGSTFYVVDRDSNFDAGNNSDNRLSLDKKNLQSFIVPKGTSYLVNDCNKDPIGLPRTLEADTRFRVRPGSQVHLQAGTAVLFPSNVTTENNKSLPVRMVLIHETICTI